MCDTVVADGSVTADGGVWFGKNSDREPNESQVVEHLPAMQRGGRVRCTHIEVDDVSTTREVVLSRPVYMWGAEMGVNDCGVAIGNEAVFTRLPVEDSGLTGMDLLRLALERASAAREAVDVIISHLKKHGQGGRMAYGKPGMRYHSSFIVADAQEAWVLETAGRFYAGHKVNGVRSISNGLTLGKETDLVDDEAFAFARNKGWCTSAADFDFTAAFAAPLFHVLTGEKARRACTAQTLLTKRGQIDRATLCAALREHNGHAIDEGLVMTMPCAHASMLPTRTSGQTTGSLVAGLAAGRQPRVFATGTSSPCLSVFKPVGLASGTITNTGPKPHERFDDQSLFWRHERLHRAVVTAPARAQLFEADRIALEARVIDDVAGADAAWATHREATLVWQERVGAPKSPGISPFGRYWAAQTKQAGMPL